MTSDGRIIIGTLNGVDQTTNIILSKAIERQFSDDEGTSTVELGLYVVRGDTLVALGPVDAELDSGIDWPTVTAAPIRPIVHQVF